MGRNVKEFQGQLFNLLVNDTNIRLNDYPNVRLYVTEEEFNQIKSDAIQLVSLKFGLGEYASIYSFLEQKYLVLPEIFNLIKHDGLVLVDNNKVLEFIHIVTNEIPHSNDVTDESLQEFVFLDKDVKDVQWESISQFFPSMSLFRIIDIDTTDTTELLLYLKKTCISAISQTKSIQQLDFVDNTIMAFLEIANSTDSNIPYDNILRSILSYHWKFCFLDLFRCQERLLKLAWVYEFKETMASGLDIETLYKQMSQKYKTEGHQDIDMKSLYQLLPSSVINSLSPSFLNKNEDKALFIYKLRNTIVHYQKSDATIESVNAEDWNNIICFILKTIPILYEKLKDYIRQLPDL